MNWDAAGAIGEIVGAAAVVVSVVYLASQIRKQTDEARMGATRDLAARYDDYLTSLTDDETLAAAYRKGVRDYLSLEDDERMRVSTYFIRGFRIIEQQYMHTAGGKLDESYFASTKIAFRVFLTFPGVRQWWASSSNLFESGFRDYIDREFQETIDLEHPSSFVVKDETAT